MYINGFVVPVPADKKDAYREVAEKFWPIARDYGCTGHVEAWESDIKDGKHTDFRRAVDLQDGEKVVFSWMTWPDKATADAAEEKMMADERMEAMGTDMPFDGRRMIVGGFDVFLDKEA
ncbi:DUF1428 domain-containing protein [Tsuneonella amylolytica]|uniref:DUF1428 domain-containing protein n=1 Tax=Tsuneonella amylolytica TaxID=2338327 RepID=UPI000EA9DAD2|nr:DUF1428 domain-containing protein [Tsuneonella amylolytica]